MNSGKDMKLKVNPGTAQEPGKSFGTENHIDVKEFNYV